MTAARPSPFAASGRAFRAAILGFALAGALAGAAAAQGVVREAHGDWQIRCDEDAPTTCALTQSVVDGVRPEVRVDVLVWKTAGEGPVLQVVAPLGVRLGEQLEVRRSDATGLGIAAEPIGRMAYNHCTAEGCLAQVILDDSVVELMRTDTTFWFVFRFFDEEGFIGVPISLDGFSAGFDALPAAV